MNEGIKNKPIIPVVFDDDKEKKANKPIIPVVFDAPSKSFEEKKYIVLINQDSNDILFDGMFKVCNGRTECYRYIQSLIESFGTDIDVHESKIITETKQTETDTGNTKYFMINFEEALSIYAFCKGVEGYYSNEKFSIDDYFSPPKDTGEDIDIEKLDTEAKRFASHIDDQILAQVAMDSFKEQKTFYLGIANRNNTIVATDAISDSGNNDNMKTPIIIDDGDKSNV